MRIIASSTVFAAVLTFASTAAHAETIGWNEWADRYPGVAKYYTPEYSGLTLVEQEDRFTPHSGLIIPDDCQPPRISESVPGLEDMDPIIALGEKVWKLIDAGRPVVNFQAPVAHALPNATTCWTELENWRPPASQTWEVNYKNGFDMNVVRFRFKVVYSAGGKWESKGAYLANVTVLPAALDVAWGYTVNAQTMVGRALNLGTKENPVAGLQLLVSWNVKTVVKDSTMSESIFVRADR
ncbi:MAG: hypothetical protein AB7N80_12840 [Bdellovibrionales bacterium]